jgi:hypothetical protein
MGGTMEAVGKMIPNEISKTNSLTKWIPGVNYATMPLAAVDNAATAYGDTGSWQNAVSGGVKGGMGMSSDPGQYGTPGGGKKDLWNMAGNAGNLFMPGESTVSSMVDSLLAGTSGQGASQQGQSAMSPGITNKKTAGHTITMTPTAPQLGSRVPNMNSFWANVAQRKM